MIFKYDQEKELDVFGRMAMDGRFNPGTSAMWKREFEKVKFEEGCEFLQKQVMVCEESKLEKYGKIIDRKPLTYTLEVAGENQAKVISAVSDELPVDDIDITHVPLDEIMADMFKRE